MHFFFFRNRKLKESQKRRRDAKRAIRKAEKEEKKQEELKRKRDAGEDEEEAVPYVKKLKLTKSKYADEEYDKDMVTGIFTKYLNFEWAGILVFIYPKSMMNIYL